VSFVLSFTVVKNNHVMRKLSQIHLATQVIDCSSAAKDNGLPLKNTKNI